MKKFILILLFLASSEVSSETADVKLRIKQLGLTESKIEGEYDYWGAGYRGFYIFRSGSKEIEFKEPPLKVKKKFHPQLSCGTVTYEGTDNGEWGGSLYASFEEGEDAKKIEILKGNVYHLVPWSNGIYIFIGSEHMDSSGSVYYLEDCDNPAKTPKLVTLLPDAPVDIEIGDRVDLARFLIIGNNSILSLLPSMGHIEILMYKPWKGTTPTTSVKLSDSTILVGLQSGIALVEKLGYKESKSTVYVPPEYAER